MAAAGPENPPCPVCGEPLFGWAVIPAGRVTVRRCETCGLGLAGPPASRAELLEALHATGADRGRRLPNRASWQATLGRTGWAAMEPGARFVLTADALRRLGDDATTGAAIGSMWQTLLNSFTFGHNVALGRLGHAEATPAARRWQRRLDLLISLCLALPLLFIAAPLELLAAVAGRGGALVRVST
jgi:hypothetical protein